MSQKIKCISGALLLGLAMHSFAQAPMEEGNFDQCLNTLITTAKENEISRSTIENTLAKVKYSGRVIELDRQQPEFTTSFADYLNRRVTQDRVDKGRVLLQKHQALLEQISKEYGVPSQYLVAFWGLETNYGSFFGKMSVLDSLATLACDPRRSDYFTGELMSALKIIDEGAISADKMEGSWAGAMGHVQFMPSAFLRHAVDYDGDGKRDLWNSIPDAMASAANFLRSLGWEKGSRWGREVSLPLDFDFLEAGLNQTRTLTEWRDAGVKQAKGDVLSAADDLTASLLVPAGYQGPAFLVYDNFRVIMKWNRSEYYALAVGHLADRITGGGKLIQQPATDAPRLSRQQVLDLQTKLAQADIDVGEPDGIFGPATRRALGEYQQKHGMIADGFAGKEILQKLGI